MPRLLLINGPPAAGKSTLARRFVEEHPLALALDVDVLREMVGGRRERPRAAGLAARAIAVAAARVHLAAGHDVVVPQLLAEPAFADALAAVTAEVGAAYVEVVLTLDKDTCLARYLRRWQDASDPVHGRGPEPDLGVPADLHDRVAAFAAGRPHVRLLAVTDPAETYANLLVTCG